MLAKKAKSRAYRYAAFCASSFAFVRKAEYLQTIKLQIGLLLYCTRCAGSVVLKFQ